MKFAHVSINFPFLHTLEARLDRELETLTDTEGEVPRNTLRSATTRYLLLAQRALQVGGRIVDSHPDPVYRDGLSVFVRKLNEGKCSGKYFL